MRPVLGVAGIVLDADGRVLLIERGRPPDAGRWSVPGGKLERGESLAAGVAREVREETGLEVEVGALVCAHELIRDDYHVVILDHVARVTGGALAAGDDAADARWVAWPDLADLPLTDGLLAVLERARATYGAWFDSR